MGWVDRVPPGGRGAGGLAGVGVVGWGLSGWGGGVYGWVCVVGGQGVEVQPPNAITCPSYIQLYPNLPQNWFPFSVVFCFFGAPFVFH